MLKPQIFSDHESVSRHAAAFIVERLLQEPTALVCLAAGATPMRTYDLLAEHGARQPNLFERCRLIKLDEWGGLPLSDPATCESHLQSRLIGPLGLGGQYVGFDSRPRDAEAECRRIADWLQRHGPIDTCVLGLGVNGHIGFNEPAGALQAGVHVARLSEASLAHSTLAAAGGRPTYGLTLGVADLLASRHIVLLVTGESKRGPLQKLLSDRITTEFPASLLALHGSVQLLCDSSAACAE